MAAKLHSKLLNYGDEHQDCCFLSISDSLHLIIAKKYEISVHCVDTNYEDILTTNCIIDNLSITMDSPLSIKQIQRVHRGPGMDNVLKQSKYVNYYSILSECDSVLILFENGHFCWFYLDICNQILKENDNMIVWLIEPNANPKYDEFMHELHSLSLHLNDWRMELMHDKNTFILSIYSYLGNVMLFIPLIWDTRLCFNTDCKVTAVWQIRSINGIIWDFKFTRRGHFMVLYTHNNSIKLLSDAFELVFDDKRNKLMMNRTDDEMRNTVIFGDAYDAPVIHSELIPHELKSSTVDELQELLHRDDVMMMLSDAHSIELHLLRRRIENEIMMKRSDCDAQDIIPKKIIELSDYDALIVFDFALVHYEESPYNKTKTKIYKIPFIGDMMIDNMILDAVYDTASSLVYIAALNGNMYCLGLDGIRHRHVEWIEYNICHTFKYVNARKILMNRNVVAVFGALSSHKLFVLKTDASVFVPQYHGVAHSTTTLYSTFGYGMGGCIAKYECILPTQSMLDEMQCGFDSTSLIMNANDKLLLFVIADQTRIRSLEDSRLPELQIAGFESNTQTLAIAYITDHILLQITTNALLIVHLTHGIASEHCIAHNHITYADIDGPFAAVIITDRQLNIYRLSAEKMIELVCRVQLKHENISNIKTIQYESELFGVVVATYDGILNVYHYKSTTPILSASLNHLSLEDHLEEPKENIVAQSIVVLDDVLFIGTRNGWLIQYELHHIQTNAPIIRHIGDLPVNLVSIQVNIDEQDDTNPLNWTQFGAQNALLCICEQCWVLFSNKQDKLELWPLDYPPNAVSHATSFNQDGESYLLLIVDGCMDIVRLMLEPRLHSSSTKIGQTVSHIVHLEETNNLLYIINCKNSTLNFVDKDRLFYDRVLVEYEAVLPDSIVTGIEVINHEENKQSILYLIALNVVFKKCFKQCLRPCVVLMKVQYDKRLKRFVQCSELCRRNLSGMEAAPIPYNIISLKMSEEIVAISMGCKLLLFSIQEGHKLELCGETKCVDFIKDIIYDGSGTRDVLSILYEKNGLDIVSINKTNDNEYSLSNVIKSWNGIFYASKHLLMSCSNLPHENESIRIETLIGDRVGNVSFMTNADQEEKAQSHADTNHILQHKCGLQLTKNDGCTCCVNQLIQCKLSHINNKNDKGKIVAICSGGSLFEITFD
eukprot:138960_1